MRKADLKRLPRPDLRGCTSDSAVLLLGVLGSDGSSICCVDNFDLRTFAPEFQNYISKNKF